MRFFADPPEGAPGNLPIWKRPLGPLGIAFGIVMVLAEAWVIGRLFFAHRIADWVLLGAPLALVGVGLIVLVLKGEAP